MLGVDIVEVKRIIEVNDNGKLEDRILSQNEKDYLKNKSTQVTKTKPYCERDYSLSGMFASKEAALKALGIGVNGINFTDIEVLHEPSGKPYLKINPELYKKVGKKAPKTIELSIAHDGEMAISVCYMA